MFTLVVPPDIQACTMFMDRGDIMLERQLHGRITFRAGSYAIPISEPTVSADWIAGVELGPDQTVPTRSEPGSFTRTIEGLPEQGTYRYEFTESYVVYDQPFKIIFRFNVTVTHGNPEPNTLTLDEAGLSSSWDLEWSRLTLQGMLGDGSTPVSQLQQYAACHYPTFRLFKHTMELEGGDILVLQQRSYLGDIVCKLCPTALVSATFTRGGVVHEQSDFFHLTYVATHHNWDQQYLVELDEPVDGINGFHAREEELGAPPTSVKYLDANLQVLESKTVTRYEQQQLE